MKFPVDTEHGYQYRPLKKGILGWDVWALQTALVGRSFNIVIDGYFGEKTKAAVLAYQRERFADKFDWDGIAGAKTQRALVLSLLPSAQSDFDLPTGLLKGQVEAESSFLLGNHTSVYTSGQAKGKLDIGLTMLNRFPIDENFQEGFNCPVVLYNLAKFLRTRKDAYYGKPGAQSHEDAWRLAVGAHNAPAWTDLMAAGKPVEDWKVEIVEAYIRRCVVYASRLNVG